MVEFYSFERATHSTGPLYVGQQQRALQHWQDVIYRPVDRNGQAHCRLQGPRGGGGRHDGGRGGRCGDGAGGDGGSSNLGAISEDISEDGHKK
jgi:hypothetical protein